MNENQSAAYIMAQAAAALIELESMKQANRDREARGEMPAYDEEAFLKLNERYCLHHNPVLTLFHP